MFDGAIEIDAQILFCDRTSHLSYFRASGLCFENKYPYSFHLRALDRFLY